MPKARKAQISVTETPYYHCVSRCVRRAFLCGQDAYTGTSYEHRRKWVEDRIHFLSEIFAIDVCAYAVMSNHTHLVLHIDVEEARSWSTMDILLRWHRLHHGTLLSQSYCNEQARQQLSEAEVLAVEETAAIWRGRLMDISWFMRSLNEFIAREANKEDDCTGRFWEGRFKSQALLDETALAACMAYVDLNPIRANMASTPEKSDHTSIQYRINAAKAGKPAKRLMPFSGHPGQHMPKGLPFEFNDYLSLVDLTAGQVARNQQGRIAESSPGILTRLNLGMQQWTELATSFEQCFYHAAGRYQSLQKYAENNNLQRIKGKKAALRLSG